jgi:hypothetical protein
VDVKRYAELLIRAAAETLAPFGIPEATLRNWLACGGDYLAPFGVVPPRIGLPMQQLGG